MTMTAKKAKPATPEPVEFPDDELRRRVAHNLARLLEAKKMDERELAEAIGWTEPSVAHGAANVRKYLRGEVFPREAMLLAWAKFFGVDPADFVKPL